MKTRQNGKRTPKVEACFPKRKNKCKKKEKETDRNINIINDKITNKISDYVISSISNNACITSTDIIPSSEEVIGNNIPQSSKKTEMVFKNIDNNINMESDEIDEICNNMPMKKRIIYRLNRSNRKRGEKVYYK